MLRAKSTRCSTSLAFPSFPQKQHYKSSRRKGFSTHAEKRTHSTHVFFVPFNCRQDVPHSPLHQHTSHHSVTPPVTVNFLKGLRDQAACKKLNVQHSSVPCRFIMVHNALPAWNTILSVYTHVHSQVTAILL